MLRLDSDLKECKPCRLGGQKTDAIIPKPFRVVVRVENRMDTVTSSTLRTCSTVAAVGVASGLLVGIFFERWRRTYTDEPPLLIAQAREPLGTNM